MRGRSNNLDLLRLMFAALVIVAHAYELTTGRPTEPLVRLFGTLTFGDLAVDAFFILSGFLITQSWQREPLIGPYLFKRVRRIYPGYFVAFAVSLVVAGLFGAVDRTAYFHGLSVVELVKDLITLHPPVAADTLVINAPMWTLSYEFACYIGLMVVGVFGLIERRWLVMSGLVVACVTAAWLHPIGRGGTHLYVIARFGSMFLSGMVFQIYRFHERREPWLIVAAAVALVACMGFSHAVEPALATFGAYLILVAGFTPLRWRNRLPDISYGLYLYGWPVEQLVIRYVTHSPELVALVSLPIAGLCGWVSWALVERTALRSRNLHNRKAVFLGVSGESLV